MNGLGEFPGFPVVRTLHVHWGGRGFNFWPGSEDPASHTAWPKNETVKSNDEWNVLSLGNVQSKFVHKYVRKEQEDSTQIWTYWEQSSVLNIYTIP